MTAPTDGEAPTASNELLPTRLYPAELVLLPGLFILAPLNLLVLGGAMYLDAQTLEEYDVEFQGSLSLWYAAPFAMAHFATLGYRLARRRAFAARFDLSTVEFQTLLEATDPPRSRLVPALFLAQIVTVGLALAGSWLFVLGFLANLVLAPLAVWRDLGRVRAVEGVAWGWPRYLHVLVAALPPFLFVYLLQRQEHLSYAFFVRNWDADPDDLAVDRERLSRTERLVERFEDVF